MRTVELLYFNAGGGHRAAAFALQDCVHRCGKPWNVRLTNVMEVIDPGSCFRRVTGMAPEDYYNKRLASGMTVGLGQELKVLQAAIRIMHGPLARIFQQHWLAGEPDLVVSLIPNLNRPLAASLASTLPGIPYLTVMTDLADLPPNFWMVPDQQQHLVCATEHAVEQAAHLGIEPRLVHRSSGMVLRPAFYDDIQLDRQAEQRALGLDPQQPTGLVLFGGHGSRVMHTIAEQLGDVQLILLCGHNTALATKLKNLKRKAPYWVGGFTPDVSKYMRLADFFIGKPGPGSISEAIHCGLPVVTVRNTWTMPQERFNPGWVDDLGVGIAGTSFRNIREPVIHLLTHLHDYVQRVRAILPNRAVFEIVDLMGDLIAQASSASDEASAAADLQTQLP